MDSIKKFLDERKNTTEISAWWKQENLWDLKQWAEDNLELYVCLLLKIKEQKMKMSKLNSQLKKLNIEQQGKLEERTRKRMIKKKAEINMLENVKRTNLYIKILFF